MDWLPSLGCFEEFHRNSNTVSSDRGPSNPSTFFPPFLLPASTTTSPAAQSSRPTSSAATGPIRWWRATSSAYTSTFSPTAARTMWYGWTRRTTRWPSSSSSLSSSHWPWSPWWSGAARGAISWPRRRGRWRKMEFRPLHSNNSVERSAQKVLSGCFSWSNYPISDATNHLHFQGKKRKSSSWEYKVVVSLIYYVWFFTFMTFIILLSLKGLKKTAPVWLTYLHAQWR